MSLFETLYLTLNGDTADFDRAIKASSKHVVKLTENVNKANNSALKLGSSLNKASGGADKFILSLVNTLKIALNVNVSLNNTGETTEKLIPRFNNVGLATSKFITHLGKLNGKTIKSEKHLYKLGAELFSLNGFLNQFVSSAKNAAVLGQLAEKIGVNVSTLDAWRRAIKESGGDVDAFTETMLNLSKQFDDPEKALLRYSEKLSKLNSIEAQKLGTQLGLDEGTIRLLREGRVGIEALLEQQKIQGVVTQEQVAKSNEFMTSMAKLENTFESIKSKLSEFLLPELEELLGYFDRFLNWVNQNQLLVSAFFETLIILMVAFGIANLVAIWPLLALAAGIFFVVATGKLFAEMMRIVIDAITEFFETNEYIQAFSKYWDQLWKDIGEGWDNLWKKLKEGWETLKGWLSWVPGFGDSNVKAKVEYGPPEQLPSLEQQPYLELPKNLELSHLDALQGYSKDPTFGGKNHLSQISTSPITTMTASSISNKRWQAPGDTKYVFGDIEIHTAATDANGIAKGFTGEVQSVIEQNDNRLLA